MLVGGGSCNDSALGQACQEADALVAADGGAERLMRLGFTPDAVIGDMDSLSLKLKLSLPSHVIHEVSEQDSTDFEKCLSRVSAPEVLCFAFLGARVDHSLAALTVLARRSAQRCILVGGDDVIALAPPRMALTLPQGMRLSLWPLGAVAGESSGLRWPIAGLGFDPAETIGTSNEVTGPVSLSFDVPRMLLILPVAALCEVRRALAAAPGWGDPEQG